MNQTVKTGYGEILSFFSAFKSDFQRLRVNFLKGNIKFVFFSAFKSKFSEQIFLDYFAVKTTLNKPLHLPQTAPKVKKTCDKN